MSKRILLTFSLATIVSACSAGSDSIETTAESTASPLSGGSNAAGVIPAALPARMTVGLTENKGGTWMKTSGTRWDTRYQYLTKGWLNNWGWGAADGQYAYDFMTECDAQGFMPVIQYYVMLGEAPANDESKFYTKTQSASVMSEYAGEFKVLMQRAKQFGKPVVIILEGDGFGFLEQQTNDSPNAYAAIAASGVPELASLPNTVAGFGMSFLQLRNAVGASNVLLGPDVSSWATGKNVTYGNLTDPLQPEVDKAYAFLAPLGLASNVTGSTFDFLATDPLDRDSDFYRITQNLPRWWDASDTASISSASFNRFAEWLRLWNQKAQKRWLLWQIPIGNSNSLNANNTGQARGGYKDNRAEYWLGTSRDAHLAKFADVGVIGLLYGAGVGGQASYQNDTYTDGQLFLKSRTDAYVAAGGMTLARGGSAPPPPPPPPPPPSGDTSQYNFEAGTQGWVSSGAPITGVASSTAQAFAGTHSLAVTFNGAAGTQSASVASPSTPAGKTISFNVWCPAGSAVTAVQPYALQGAAGNWAWSGNWKAMSSLKAGAWNTLTVSVPTNAAPLYQLGVQLTTGSTWAGTCYVDAVAW